MTNEVTVELALNLSEDLHDLLIAELDADGFAGFVQDETELKAYIPSRLWTKAMQQRLQLWLQAHDEQPLWQEQEIVPQDWNSVWEASIQPIRIPPFYVRPSWAEAKEGLIDIVVDPKMSFGTGHHETTRLLLKLMSGQVKSGDKVLDAGAGTAILGIAAIKLGASAVLAFDVDPWVKENVEENLSLNQVSDRIEFQVGTMKVVGDEIFDMILANINRNVLLDYLDAFAKRIKKDGTLMLSGVLVEDREMMQEAARNAGFEFEAGNHEGSWWAGVFKRI